MEMLAKKWKGLSWENIPRRGDTTEGDEDSVPYRTDRGLFFGKLNIYQCCTFDFLFLILPSFLLTLFLLRWKQKNKNKTK